MSDLTPRAKQVLDIAKKEAERFNCHYVGTEHLLMGLIKIGDGMAINILQKMGADVNLLYSDIEKQISYSAPDSEQEKSSSIPYTPRVKKVLALSGKEAKALNHSYVGTEHLLLGLLRDGDGMAARILKTLGITLEQTRNEIHKLLDPKFMSEEEEEDDDAMLAGSGSDAPKGRGATPALKAFGRDLTTKAHKGEMDPVIGREKEIERIIQILCRRTKNNPVLIGEAGVGKTAIVEGLAQEIVAGNVPDILHGKRVVMLDLALMVAGTKYRGQFEERIKGVMEEIRKAKNVILFIDEMHTVVGAGSAEGAMDASNIIKPALARGELQCIGATTLNEFRKNIEKDSALERRFQQVIVDAPSVDDAIDILKGLSKKYEEYHKVTFSEKSLQAAVRLSERYLTSRYLPDKAIDAMDEAGSRARIAASTRPPNIKSIEKEIEEVRLKKEACIKDQNFEKAGPLRDEEKKLKEKLENTLAEWKAKKDEQIVEIQEEDIMQIISKWTGVPLSRLSQKDRERLLEVTKDLCKEVIGQNEAAEALGRSLKRSRADLKDPKRPIGSFIFLGPTGVGKTLLAKKLSEYMFGSLDSLIQVDMSEYMEKFNVSRLVGAPPGYVGYEDGGQLTEKVRRHPYSVVLFDEIEKAHPDIWNVLLQILEDGVVTDGLGRKIDFRNTIIILTSNVGADVAGKQSKLGFGGSKTEDTSYSEMKEKMLQSVKKTFRPEFINRLDDIIVFRSLNKEDITKIVDLEVAKLSSRLKAKHIELKLSQKVLDFLIEKGYKPEYGARNLRRAVEKYIEQPLAEEILKGDLDDSSEVFLDMKDNEIIFLPSGALSL